MCIFGQICDRPRRRFVRYASNILLLQRWMYQSLGFWVRGSNRGTRMFRPYVEKVQRVLLRIWVRVFVSIERLLFDFVCFNLISDKKHNQQVNKSICLFPRIGIPTFYNNYFGASLKMQLIIQNSKDLKQVRQFIKGLNYVYDSITQKQKQIFLYISIEYIALVNNFMDSHVNDFKVCYCKFKRNMYKLKNFNDEDQVIYQIDSDLMTKLLNTQVEPDINQLVFAFPQFDRAEETKQMVMSYDADGVTLQAYLVTRQEQTTWPFKNGEIGEDFLPNSTMVNFLVYPPKFVKQIEYAKKFPEIWMCLSADGLNIKKTQGNYVIFEHSLKKQQFGEYDFIYLKQALKGNIYLCIRSDTLFHHLQLSNKENRKTQAKIIVQQQYYKQVKLIKSCYLYLTTATQKKQVHQFYQIKVKTFIEFNGDVIEVQRLKLRFKDTKKQQEVDEQRFVMNRFYGPDRDEKSRNDAIMRDGLIKHVEPKGQETITNARKYKIELE